MTKGAASSSRSATHLTARSQGDVDFVRQSKRLREDLEVPIIVIKGNQESTPATTLTGQQQEAMVVKLDRLYDKHARFESHRQFLQRCIKEKVIPNGLKINLEPTIGNYDDKFLTKWYDKLQSFSISLMEDVDSFCQQTTN